MSDKCHGLFGRIRCNFEPRYDTTPTGNVNLGGSVSADEFVRCMEPFKIVTYICDVCTACGEQRARPFSEGRQQ